MKVVIDTNILISDFIFGGVPKKVLDIALNPSNINIKSVYSLETKAEVEEKFLGGRVEQILNKLNRKYEKEQVINYLNKFFLASDRVEISHKVNILDERDKKDNKFLELAVSSKADFIITGDKDLLSLGACDDIRIVRPNDFILLY